MKHFEKMMQIWSFRNIFMKYRNFLRNNTNFSYNTRYYTNDVRFCVNVAAIGATSPKIRVIMLMFSRYLLYFR